MSRNAPRGRAKITGAKRRSLAEEINNLELQGDEVIFNMFEDLQQMADDSVGFRWQARSTQKRQDRIKTLYIRLLKLFSNRVGTLGFDPLPPNFDELDEGTQDQLLWPTDEKQLTAMGRIFMNGIATYGKSSSRSGGRMSYLSYTQYRDAFMFWANRTWTLHERPKISLATLKNSLTQTMRYVAARGLLETGTRSKRTYCNDVGLPELRMLIDYDILHTGSQEVAEIHHLAWALGRMCALRPGSIGWSHPGLRDEGMFLKWKDVSISRGQKAGMFEVKLNIRCFKTNYAHDVERSNFKPELMRTKCFNIMPAQDADSMFLSVPHRLLVIALRRGILKHYRTIDELLDGDRHNIIIQEKYLDEPVLLKAKAKGDGVVSNQPLSAHSLTSYLKDRGMKVRFPETITFYSLRRRSANELARNGEVGVEIARALLNYDPETRTLERYYIDPIRTLDVSALALGEKQNQDRMKTREAELALNVLADDEARAIFGPLLNATMNKVMAEDESYPRNATPTELRNYKRRVRWATIQSLFNQATRKQVEDMKLADEQERIKRIEECAFTKSIIERAKAALRSAPNISAADDELNEDIDMGTGLFKVPEEKYQSFPAEPDAEAMEEDEVTCYPEENETHSEGAVEDLQEGANEDGQYEPEQTIEYKLLAKSFMEILLEAVTYKRDYKNNPIQCSLCIEDETVEADMKRKTYSSRVHLAAHQQSEFHTPMRKWKRMYDATYLSLPVKEANDFLCPYCKELGVERSYTTWRRLLEHLCEEQYPSRTITFTYRYKELQNADGWNDEDFFEFQDLTEGRMRYVNAQNQKRLKRMRSWSGISFSKDKELLAPVDHEWHDALVRGGGEEFSSAAHRAALESMDEAADDPGYPVPSSKRQATALYAAARRSDVPDDYYYDSEVHERM